MQHPAPNSFAITKRFLVALLLACTTSAVHAADSLSLPQAIGLAIKNSPSLHALHSGMDAVKAQQSYAKSAYLPTASANASYANLGPLESINFPLQHVITSDQAGTQFARVVDLNIPIQFFPANNWDIHAGVDYLIYDFGKRAKSVELTKIGEEGLATGTELTSNGVAYQAVLYFESILSGGHRIDAKNEEIANLGQHLDYVRRRLATGSTTQFEELSSQAHLSNAQTDSANLANDQDKMFFDFCQLLGVDPSARFALSGTFDSSFTPFKTDSLVAAALKSRHELDLLNTAVHSLQVQQSLVRLNYYPALAAHAQIGGKNGYIPDLDQLQFNWVVAAQVEAPLFDGNRTRIKLREIKAHLDSAETVLNDAKRRITTEVLKAAADVESGFNTLRMARTNVDLTSEAYRIAKLQYEAGVIRNIDLLDAESQLTQSRLAEVLAEFRYTLARYALQQAIGFNFASLAESKPDR